MTHHDNFCNAIFSFNIQKKNVIQILKIRSLAYRCVFSLCSKELVNKDIFSYEVDPELEIKCE